MQLFLAFIVALSITAVLIPLLEKWAPGVGLTDRPGPRKVHVTPVPRVGGIAMTVGIVAALLLTVEPDPRLSGVLLGITVLLVFGVWDDRADLDYRIKFVGQLIAVLLCVIIGDIRIESVTLDARYAVPPVVSYPITVLFLIGVTNAVNLSDGLDGLAGGMALLCCCAIALLAAVSGGQLPLAIALIAAGAVLGFLRFNTHPARIFMGDSGSQVLGFTMGVLALLVTQGDETAMSAALPLLLIGMPILDTVTVMMRRISEGRSPFSADNNHLHHRLLALGCRHSEAVAIVYLLQAILFVIAYSMRFDSDLTIVIVFAVFYVVVFGANEYAIKAGWRVRRGGQAMHFARAVDGLRGALPAARVAQVAGWSTAIAVAGYVGLVLLDLRSVGSDLFALCIVLLAIVSIGALATSNLQLSWLDRLITYVSIALLVYLDQSTLGTTMRGAIPWLLLAIAAASAVARTAASSQGRFQATTLDLLVVFLALAVPALAQPAQLPRNVVEGVAKAVLLLYVAEMSFTATVGQRVVRAMLVIGIGALALRAALVAQV